MTTKSVLAALAVLGSITWALTVPGVAGAAPSPTAARASVNSTFRDVSTGFCLDSNTNRNVYTLGCNGGNFQNWVIAGSGGTIRNVATGRCLDSNTNREVYTLPCNGGNFQNWSHR